MTVELPERIHCVGAGGAGMLPLALCLRGMGKSVTAEDAGFSDDARRCLEAAGVAIVERFDPSGAVGLVARSSAVGMDDPSVAAALDAGWTVARRGECLATLAKGKKLLAIAGSHGKTTTTAMAVDLLSQLGVEFSYALGGLFRDGRAPGVWSAGEWLVAEIDESDGTIEGFDPEICVVLNADYDHHSHYASAREYLAAFERLIGRTKGIALCAVELQGQFQIAGKEPLWLGAEGDIRCSVNRPASTYSELSVEFSDGAKWSRGVARGGMFNALNAAFAAAAIRTIAPIDRLPGCLEFSGAQRRQSCQWISPGLRVIDDYAHHPKEIDALLDSLELRAGERLAIVFQPHRFSRTLRLKDEFARSLVRGNVLYLLDVYAASERSIAGGSSSDLESACIENIGSSEDRRCELVSDGDQVLRLVREEAKRGPLVALFLGAGETHRLAARLADELAGEDPKFGTLFRSLGTACGINARLLANEPLAAKTTLRVGGSAELFFEPASVEELQSAIKSCATAGVPIQVMGRGSNLIIPDSGVAGLVVRLSHPRWRSLVNIGDGRIVAGAGVRIKELCSSACRWGMLGLEFLEGIPGCVGGALRMNAGAMGGWTFDVVESVVYLNRAGDLIRAKKEDLEIGYRHCRELIDAIAIEATLVSKESGHAEADLRRNVDTYQRKRKESQPRDPSAGCIFKNPEGDSAGRLIDQLGLKGTKIGGAEFSLAHGNFIVNTNGASAADVIELVKLARRVAWSRKRVELEPEALLFGGEWKEVLS